MPRDRLLVVGGWFSDLKPTIVSGLISLIVLNAWG